MAALLVRHPQACDAVAALLGYPAEWSAGWPAAERPAPVEVRELLTRHPATTGAIAALLGR
ncbi:hypothetical protein ACFHYQ_07795 [Sphaerimonospora cavernae]|uniref:Uncharacterized protein n=1 Tax=Sphaerimonospora cavernae TaxID=1740611 RepID=A0ABV6U4Z7_9ACTN